MTLAGGSVSVQGVGGGEKGLQAMGAGSLITANDVAVNVLQEAVGMLVCLPRMAPVS